MGFIPNSKLEFICGDIVDEVLPENSVDAIISCFILHEVYSHSHCNERIITRIIGNHFKSLKIMASLLTVIFITGGISTLEMPDEPVKEKTKAFTAY